MKDVIFNDGVFYYYILTTLWYIVKKKIILYRTFRYASKKKNMDINY